MQNPSLLKPISMSDSCGVCHLREVSVQPRDIKKTYVPQITYVLLLLAPLIGLILMAVLRVEHNITLPFCETCWKGKKFASLLHGLSALLLLGSLPAGFAVMLQFDSGWAFFPLPAIALAAILALEIYKRKYQPKYKLIDKHRIVIKTRDGDLEFAKITQATLHPA
jgi:hypothetical protein